MPAATLTDAGRNLLRDAELGIVSDITIHYVAVGTSSTAPATGQTALGGESFRKATTSVSAGSAGVGNLVLYLAPGDANGVGIQEVGWFAGVGATSTPGSGVMVARGLYVHAKVAGESIQVTYTITE